MNAPTNWQDELKSLCDAAIEDRLTADEMQRLEQLVLERPEVRRFYVEHLQLHGCLHWPMNVGETRKVERETKKMVPVRRIAWVAGLAASVLVGLWFFRSTEAPALATLAESKGCKWNGGSLPTEDGARLGAGRLRLAEGVARITFHSGAEITLEAPAELELVSARRCVLHAGRLVAKVPPPAVGFTVDTPAAILEDLGTEFGVHVNNGKSDVQVFNGIVDVHPRGTGRTERLLTGNNRRFGAEGGSDFDPQAEPPVGPAQPPVDAGARILRISSALGRGRDAYVQPLYPSPTHSSDVLLLVKNSLDQKSGYLRKAYIGIDLASMAGNKVVDAQLTFTLVPTGMGFASEVPDATFVVYGLTDEKLDNWNERTIRWLNAPANQPGGAEIDPARTVRLGTFEVPQGVQTGTRSISGQALVDFLNRDSNSLATFILVRQTPGSGRYDLVHGFAGRNHPTLPAPTLQLTVAPR